MKKMIFVLLSILIISFALTGCYSATVEKDPNANTGDSSSMFVVIERSGTWTVVYHKETKVIYVGSYGSHNCGSFTVLVNPDGTPMLWEG